MCTMQSIIAAVKEILFDNDSLVCSALYTIHSFLSMPIRNVYKYSNLLIRGGKVLRKQAKKHTIIAK